MSKTVDETANDLKQSLIEYIEATYHIADPSLLVQRRALLEEEGVIHQSPYLESTPRYKSGKPFRKIDGLDAAAVELLEAMSKPDAAGKQLLFNPPYTHQAQSLKTVAVDGRNAVIMTGTGSGKTESFVMPIMAGLAAEAKHRPKVFAESAMRALILYPMNALVNDQLGRLRAMFGDARVVALFKKWAGRPPRFARYTSRTPYAGVRTKDKDQKQLKAFSDFYVNHLELARGEDPEKSASSRSLIDSLKSRGKWPGKPDMERWFYGKGKGKAPRWQDAEGNFIRAVTLPDDTELVTRHEVQKTAPDLLVTNYSMLEYMLMRPVERPIFDQTRAWLKNNPDEKFLIVLDEAHLYRGASGTEVGLLLRRLRERLDITPDRFQVICATASFESEKNAPSFASKLAGVPIELFDTVVGDRLYREGAAAGSDADARLLAAMDMTEAGFYSADDAVKAAAAVPFLRSRGFQPPGDLGVLLHAALEAYGPLSLLVNHTMGQARPASELGAHIFPGVDQRVADLAVTNLAALATNARKKADDPSLLPCRVHSFFRGLRGLWACMDPDCSELEPEERSVTGKLYAQPREICGCGSRVLEFFTCRVCGSPYARGYCENAESPDSVWNEPGTPLRTSGGEIEPLNPLDMLLVRPGNAELAEPWNLDLRTLQMNAGKPGGHNRTVYLPPSRLPTGTRDEDDDGDDQPQVAGKFRRCGICEMGSTHQDSPVQDHETKGDQPFQVLLGKQLQVQPPGHKAANAFAPLRGRKVLAFSDSRQVAARLAPNLQMYAARDALRPLMVRGWQRLSQLQGYTLRLNDIYAAVLLAAAELGVRLRPELSEHESFSEYATVVEKVQQGILDNDADLIDLCMEIRSGDGAPEALLADIVSTMRDRLLGLEALAIASVVERADRRATLEKLPDIPGIATDPETKVQLARAWLRQWTTAGCWMHGMKGRWYKHHIDRKVRVEPRTGTFRKLDRWLQTTETKRQFKQQWLPALLKAFCEPMSQTEYRLVGNNVSLALGGQWVRCADCKSVHRPVGKIRFCLDCGHEAVEPMDPDTDIVFAKRKGYYRRSIQAALGPHPEVPMALIAAEHTAQLNAAGNEGVFSKSEVNELLFQDVQLPSDDERRPRVAIDVLSSTTTMEVGIDIGQLSAVALRNMPPGRANYQQRAGRAGRRGNSIATVVAFGGSDTHDEHFFSKPRDMISGPVVDPTLTLDNRDIAMRHVRAFLLQAYHRERLPSVDASQNGSLFSVLGNVADFLLPGSPLNLDDFKQWLHANEEALRARVQTWMPVELTPTDRDWLLNEMVGQTEHEIEKAVIARIDEPRPKAPRPEQEDPIQELEAQAEADEEKPPQTSTSPALLDTLLYKGVLPRYAFPTDVATFHVFARDSQKFRPKFEFVPSQGLNVALSQYAPGKQVWISGKCYTSGAIYSPFERDRKLQWVNRKLYLECSRCGYAYTTVAEGDLKKGSRLSCPACEGSLTLGPAAFWMRPTGFAHPADEDPVTSPDDMPLTSYATRARLTLQSPAEAAWTVVSDRIRFFAVREHLLVSNTGPKRRGYTYCDTCGRIEATAEATGKLLRPHLKPYPDEKQPKCTHGFVPDGVVLGTDFVTDVALFSFRLDDPYRLKAGETITQIALRTVSEALARAACNELQVDPGEIQAEFRGALSQDGVAGLETEIFLYDTLPGGAGFAKAAADKGKALFEEALRLMEGCPNSDCDSSCYRCLRTFRNRMDHSALDRHAGAALLRAILGRSTVGFDRGRLQVAADILAHDLRRQVDEGWQVTVCSGAFMDDDDIHEGIDVTDGSGARHLLIVRSPIVNLEYDSTVAAAGPWASATSISELTIRKSLAKATQAALRAITGRE